MNKNNILVSVIKYIGLDILKMYNILKEYIILVGKYIALDTVNISRIKLNSMDKYVKLMEMFINLDIPEEELRQ